MWWTIGQTKITAFAEKAIIKGQLAQAYLLVGPKHIGKNTLALDFARALNCQGEAPPCNSCQSCKRIGGGNHADVIVLNLESPYIPEEGRERTKIGIKKIQFLQNSAGLPAYEGQYKIFIIDSAEDMSNEAANCLLKILEEPPPKVIIFLLTADESQISPTIVSRCQRLELTPVSLEAIENTLYDRMSGEKNNNARLISRLAKGCPGRALNIAANPAYFQQRAEKVEQMLSLLSSGYGKRLLDITQFKTDRKYVEELIQFWLDWWRDVMLTKCNCNCFILNIDQIPMLEMWSRVATLSEIKDFIKHLQRSLLQLTLNANPQLILECLLLNMPNIKMFGNQDVYKSN